MNFFILKYSCNKTCIKSVQKDTYLDEFILRMIRSRYVFLLCDLMHVFSFSKGGAKNEIIRKEKHTRRFNHSRGRC